MPVDRMRALTEEQRHQVFNSLSSGFWKRAPLAMGGGEARIVNNTITCDGPWLVVFREAPPPITFAPVPEKWVGGSTVRLFVAKGTLVPATDIYNSRRSWIPSGFGESIAKRRRRLPPRGVAVAPEVPMESASYESELGYDMDSSVDGSMLSEPSSPGKASSDANSNSLPGSPTKSLPEEQPSWRLPEFAAPVPWCTKLAAAHEHVISILEAGIASPEVAAAPAMASTLRRQLSMARVSLEEVRRAQPHSRDQSGTSVQSLSKIRSLSRAGTMPTVSEHHPSSSLVAARNNAVTGSSSLSLRSERSDCSERSDGGSSLFSEVSHSYSRRKASLRRSVSTEPVRHGSLQSHFSHKIGAFSRGKSDGSMLSSSSRRQSLTAGLRRLFLGNA